MLGPNFLPLNFNTHLSSCFIKTGYSVVSGIGKEVKFYNTIMMES